VQSDAEIDAYHRASDESLRSSCGAAQCDPSQHVLPLVATAEMKSNHPDLVL